MTLREPKRLTDMPETGRVAIGHTSQEAQVRRIARENMCDYLIREIVPPGNAYIMNMDQFYDPQGGLCTPLSSLWWRPDHRSEDERWRIPDAGA